MMQRRAFLTGLVGIIASPAIVRASSLMPVKVVANDGIALTSMAHPFSNTLGPGMDLNEASLELLAMKLNDQHNNFRRYLSLRRADYREVMRFSAIPDIMRGAT